MSKSLLKSPYFYAFIISFAMFSGVYAQYQLSPISNLVMEKYHLSMGMFASLFTAPMVSAIFLSIPSGILIDRFGAKKVLSIAVLVSTFGLGLRLIATNYTTLYLSMFMSGIIVAVINASIAKILVARFPLEDVSRIVSLVIAGETLGTIVGTSTTLLFSSIQHVFILSFLLITIAAILIIFFLYIPPLASKSKKEEPDIKLLALLQQVLKSKNIWLTGLSVGLITTVNICFSSYLPLALQYQGHSDMLAGLSITVVLIGYAIGALFGSRILYKMKNLRRFSITFGLIATLGTAFAWRIPASFPLLTSLTISGFAMGVFVPILMAMPLQFKEIGQKLAGTAGGVVGTLQVLCAVIIPTFVILPLSQEDFKFIFLLSSLLMLAVIFLMDYIRLQD